MTAQDRPTNKAKFENGDKPQGSDFSDLIDSSVTLVDATAQTITSKLGAAEFVGPVSAADTSISGTITYTGATTVAAIATGAVTLPASAEGFVKIVVAGVSAAIPYYRLG